MVLETTLPAYPDFECGDCGAQVRVGPTTMLKRSVKVPGLEDVRELGVECPGCGKRWQLGHVSGDMDRQAEAILKERDPAKRGALHAAYLRAFRQLQTDLAVRRRAGLL